MEDIIIHMALALILSAIKNPEKKAKLKTALCDLAKAIAEAYPEGCA